MTSDRLKEATYWRAVCCVLCCLEEVETPAVGRRDVLGRKLVRETDDESEKRAGHVCGDERSRVSGGRGEERGIGAWRCGDVGKGE